MALVTAVPRIAAQIWLGFGAVGPDEARARETLLAMMDLLARDPYEAMGLKGSPDAAQLRSAFLQATKRFHPAKFARMSAETQKLSNEVFLSLRNAYDTLTRPLVKQGGAPTPVAAGVPASAARSSSPVISGQRMPTPPPGPSTPVRPTPPAGAPVTPAARSTGGTTPPAGRPSVLRPSPLAAGARPASHNPTAPPGGAASRAQAPSGSTSTSASTSASPPSRASAPSIPTAERELAPIVELLNQQQFAVARAALEVLAAKAPDVARYRALIAYSRGREAQLERRMDEARVELMDALQIDPELQLAKTALAELFTRRK